MQDKIRSYRDREEVSRRQASFDVQIGHSNVGAPLFGQKCPVGERVPVRVLHVSRHLAYTRPRVSRRTGQHSIADFGNKNLFARGLRMQFQLAPQHSLNNEPKEAKAEFVYGSLAAARGPEWAFRPAA